MTLKEQIELALIEHGSSISFRDLRKALNYSSEDNTQLIDAINELALEYINYGLLIDSDLANFVRVLSTSKRTVYEHNLIFIAKETLIYADTHREEYFAQGDTPEEAIRNLEHIL